MIDIENILSRLETVPIPSEGFNFLPIESVFWGKSKEGYYLFAKKVNNKSGQSIIQNTSHLDLYINQAFTTDKKTEEQLSAVILKSNDKRLIETFIRLSISVVPEISDRSFYDYFLALKEIFSNSREKSEQELQGLYAELYILKYFKDETNVDISVFYQSYEKMKFDYSVTDKKKIEIKSTLKEERVHHFRQEQLNTQLYDIFVMSLLLRRDDRGLSLFDLVQYCKKEFCFNLSFIAYIEKFICKTDISFLQNIKFNEEYTKNNLRIVAASVIPKIDHDPISGVYNIEFDSNMESCESTSNEDFIKWVKNG
jgi:hypothetical protein